MSTAAGWYPAPDGTFRMQWWDGRGWAERYETPLGDDARRMSARQAIWAKQVAAKPFTPNWSFWIVAPLALLMLVVGGATGGIWGVLIIAGLFAMVTAGYSLLTARRGWLSIPSRRFAALVAGVSLVSVLIGGTFVSTEPREDSNHIDAAATIETGEEPEVVAEQAAFSEESAPDPQVVMAASELPSVVVIDDSATEVDALALLNTLVVQAKAAKAGYSRTQQFGAAWIDVDGNGCDTRNDILRRDLRKRTSSGACRVLSGELTSPYSGDAIAFLRGNETSPEVQIDHVVSLSNAWQTGAQQLTQAQRIALANDPINLFAVDASSNAEKGASDAASWLPSDKGFQCEYVSHQISVKATYGLWVTSEERRAMSKVLAGCRREPSVSSVFAPRLVAEQSAIPYASTTVVDPALAVGTSAVNVAGVPGTLTATYRITYLNGVETVRVLVSEVVSQPAVDEVVHVAPPPAVVTPPSCDPNYSGQCVPIASDVDCAGGSGNGPGYTRGPVTVVGTDIYQLDRDGDGVACD